MMIQKNDIKNLRLFTSNRLEILADKLAGILSAPLSSPMEPEIIVVQSKGMERWIAMELARRFGICANVKFPFPNSFVYEMIRNVIPDMPEEDRKSTRLNSSHDV
jgi:exodeoxyribonuclease V gamma subunit